MFDISVGLHQTAPAPADLLPPAAPLAGTARGTLRWLRHGSWPGQPGAKTHLRPPPAVPQVREPLRTITQAAATQAGVLFDKQVSDKVSGLP